MININLIELVGIMTIVSSVEKSFLCYKEICKKDSELWISITGFVSNVMMIL